MCAPPPGVLPEDTRLPGAIYSSTMCRAAAWALMPANGAGERCGCWLARELGRSDAQEADGRQRASYMWPI